MKILTVLALLCASAAVVAEDSPLVFKTTPAQVFTVQNPCLTSQKGCFIFIYDDRGRELVRISERTGKVTVAHPEKQDEAARQFWLAMERTFAQLACSTGEGKPARE
jgi:hypothetical protein